MDKIICHECGTENESEFLYCKNCGAKLKEEEQKTQYEPNFNEPNDTNFAVDTINGIESEQVVLFVGKKASFYFPKFSKMVILGKKTSWNFAPALLGLFMGPIGAALWCFYRKIYKAAAVLLAIGVLLAGITTVLTYDDLTATFDGVLSAMQGEDAADVLESLNGLETSETAMSALASNVDDLFCLATAIVMGLFGNYIYMNHCTNAIKKYRGSGLDQRYYKLGLASLGGTSGGMLAIGIILFIGIENLATTVAILTHILK
ncbi:MAG: hypothetical protein IJP22_04435 [Clostridia bacterium]|nr:hypothetical protein [Clostridia bacterium]